MSNWSVAFISLTSDDLVVIFLPVLKFNGLQNTLLTLLLLHEYFSWKSSVLSPVYVR